MLVNVNDSRVFLCKYGHELDGPPRIPFLTVRGVSDKHTTGAFVPCREVFPRFLPLRSHGLQDRTLSNYSGTSALSCMAGAKRSSGQPARPGRGARTLAGRTTRARSAARAGHPRRTIWWRCKARARCPATECAVAAPPPSTTTPGRTRPGTRAPATCRHAASFPTNGATTRCRIGRRNLERIWQPPAPHVSHSGGIRARAARRPFWRRRKPTRHDAGKAAPCPKTTTRTTRRQHAFAATAGR